MAQPNRPPDTFKRRKEFLLLASKGRKLARPGFLIQARQTESAAPVRVGYTATKKLGNAVARNRARRRLKEAVRLNLPGFATKGAELVFVCRKETATLPFPVLCGSLRAALAEVLAPEVPA